MNKFEAVAVLLSGIFAVASCGSLAVVSQAQSPPAKDTADNKVDTKPTDLVGSRWDGSVTWGEKRSTKNRTAFQAYSMKVTLRFEAEGMCKGPSQPCKWEKDGNNVKVTLERTKRACPASASLVLNGNSMTGAWDHYGGFTCFLIPPQRQVKLARHD